SYRVAAYNNFGASVYSSATAMVKPAFALVGAASVLLAAPATSGGTVRVAGLAVARLQPAALSLGGREQEIVSALAAAHSAPSAGTAQGSLSASDAFWQLWGSGAGQGWLGIGQL